MNYSRVTVLALSIALGSASAAEADITYKQNKAHQTIALSGLYDDPSCATNWPLNGRVIRREFESDDLTIKGFIIEKGDGTRDYVNVSVPDNLSMAVRSIVDDGLQRLLKPGRVISGQAVLCGVSGRIVQLTEVR